MRSSAKTILIVDDEKDILDLLKYNLQREGYEILTAPNGEEALNKMTPQPDLVILDLMMPVLDGLETCRRLKNNPHTSHIPVIFLTARGSEVDEVVGLELGADDYIQKPISPRKLVARVKTVFRRLEQSPGGGEKSLISVGGLEINRSKHTVFRHGREITFARKEFEILALLASHPGKVFTREMLLNQIWGKDVVVVDRTVDVHIRKIREKLGTEDDLIETIKGVGYRFKE